MSVSDRLPSVVYREGDTAATASRVVMKTENAPTTTREKRIFIMKVKFKKRKKKKRTHIRRVFIGKYLKKKKKPSAWFV